ncbi:AGC protein kinase, variant [Aphanomyces invadans]|uniref:AGC protein kinase, variant n=1 Tax=Aphanomyces invadans TaxID=157072 RepID=A0A024U6S9_9STRA|nr:AGC protein kinase, variant [Aphanomyces invadans]ETW01964.1 AGC protein kinase, variant [Aphanomyces invadans]|eukprot:XP_008869812.1 AGC protein kinase, variant [Aphanomyces invadans]
MVATLTWTLRDGVTVAVKEVERTCPSRIARLDAEKDALGCILQRTFDVDDATFLVMDFFPGEPLYKCLWRRRQGFPEAFAKQCVAQIVMELLGLHGRGYMHRDLKTGNVLLDSDGTCHLIDFGFAKRVQADEVEGDNRTDGRRAMSFVGTHYAMAPEIYRARWNQPGTSYTSAVDWWALGVLTFELLHGSPPWPYKCEDGDLLRYAAQVEKPIEFPRHAHFDSMDVRDLISRLLCVDPSARLVGAAVKSHRWFAGINWEDLVVIPTTDVVPPPETVPPLPDSAESVTSAENALFAGF